MKQRAYNFEDQAQPCKIQVNVARLDDYTKDIKNLSYIKMDIEGGEINCLKGAKTTLSKHRPLVSVEYGFPGYNAYGNTKDTLFDFAKNHDFVLYDLFLNCLEDRKHWHLACDSIYWDFFMVPVEKRTDFLRKLAT